MCYITCHEKRSYLNCCRGKEDRGEALDFTTPALAAVPVAATATPSPSCSGPFDQLLDLLLLRPTGQLQLCRGPTPLLTLNLQLQRSCLDVGFRLHGVTGLGGHAGVLDLGSAGFTAAEPQAGGFGIGTGVYGGSWRGLSQPGSVGSLEDMVMSDMGGSREGLGAGNHLALSPVVTSKAAADVSRQGIRGAQQAAAVAAAAQEGRRSGPAVLSSNSGCVSWLSQPQGDWLTVGLNSGGQVRVQLQLSFMPGLPLLAMQAVATVLSPVQQLQLLAQCLLQPEAGSGVLKLEWRAITRVLLAWVADPGFLAQGSGSEGFAGAGWGLGGTAIGGSGGGDGCADVAGVSSLAAVATPASTVANTPLASRYKVQLTPQTQQHRLSRAAGVEGEGPVAAAAAGGTARRGSTEGMAWTPGVGFKGGRAAAEGAAGGTPLAASGSVRGTGGDSDEDMEMATPSSVAATPAGAAGAMGLSPSPIGGSEMDISAAKPSRSSVAAARGTPGYAATAAAAAATPSPLATGFGYGSDMEMSTVKPSRRSAAAARAEAAGGGFGVLEDDVQLPLQVVASTPDQGAAAGDDSEDMDMDVCTPLTAPQPRQATAAAADASAAGDGGGTPATAVTSARGDPLQQQQQQQGEQGLGVAAGAGAGGGGAVQPGNAWKQLLNRSSTKALLAKYPFLNPDRCTGAAAAVEGEAAAAAGGRSNEGAAGGRNSLAAVAAAAAETSVEGAVAGGSGAEGGIEVKDGSLECVTPFSSHRTAAAGGGKGEEHQKLMLEVLEVLHSLYEDSKLYRTRSNVMPLIGSTLLQLAVKLRAWAYADYYLRDLGPHALEEAGGAAVTAAIAAAAAAGKGSSSSCSSGGMGAGESGPGLLQQQPAANPADLRRALTALLAADESYSRWLPQLVVAGRSSSSSSSSHLVSRSCQLVQCYQLLSSCTAECLQLMSSFWGAAATATTAAVAAAGGGGATASTRTASSSSSSTLAILADLGLYPGSSSSSSRAGQSGSSSSNSSWQLAVALRDVVLSYSQQLVGLLALQGWGVMDLEGLPMGVAIPLREALARCRSHPLTGATGVTDTWFRDLQVVKLGKALLVVHLVSPRKFGLLVMGMVADHWTWGVVRD